MPELPRSGVTGAGAGPAIVAAGAHDERPGSPLFQVSHRVSPAGGIIVKITGDLDIATAGLAADGVRSIIGRHAGPVIADVAGLRFCDVQGLGALVRMARHAGQAGRPFWLASPGPSLVRLIRIARVEHWLPPVPGHPGIPPG
jgi:anti-sigma B factor antagonist